MANDKTGKNFIGVATAIFGSKALGFLRDMAVAASLGTSRLADIYTQIFYGMASLLFTSIGIAISSVNIPNLTHYNINESEKQRKNYVEGLFAQITLIALVVSIIGIILAPFVQRLILPGLDSSMTGIAVTLTRIMFPSLIFICLTYITSGILQVHKHFIASAVISIPFNILIIVALFIWKKDMYVLGYVTTIGWLLQFLIQLPILIKEKYRLSLRLHIKNPHIRDIYVRLIPILLGNMALQLCLITGRSFASHLGEGSAAALTYGSNLFTIITSIFIVAISTVTFPELSKHCLERNFERVRQLLNYIFKVLSVVLVPYIIIVAVYSKDIIRFIYQRGTFTEQSTDMTSTAFLFYSLCIVGYVSQEIFNRVYYALKKTVPPMILSLTCIIINIILIASTYKLLGITGIAGSTAVAFLIYAVIMNISVRKEVGEFLGRNYIRFFLRLLICSVPMFLVFMIFRMLQLKGAVGTLILPVALGGCVYLALCYATGIIKETIRRV